MTDAGCDVCVAFPRVDSFVLLLWQNVGCGKKHRLFLEGELLQTACSWVLLPLDSSNGVSIDFCEPSLLLHDIRVGVASSYKMWSNKFKRFII